ncbi:protein JOKA2-like [Rutidosis leptorrhynchoides]|uniref:protein JOKA2-like n=1 Tax=Rutidosis leptorrhynchoides TaxID=125765 RepID=UPI003A9A4D75
MSSSSIVIKVKYGETLRRFNVSVDDKKLALDIAMLRDKIRSLFTFGSDVIFTLTYVDEDGDVVTLADDDDLHDVVRQSLNPLRITVTLNNGDVSKSSANSTPLRSPSSQPFNYLNAGTAELMKAVPDPYREFLAKNAELAAKVTSSSSPIVSEIFEKMKLMFLDPNSTTNANQGVNPGPTEPLIVKDNKVNTEAESSKLKKVKNVTEGVQKLRNVDLNLPYFEHESPINATKDDVSTLSGPTGLGQVAPQAVKVATDNKNDSGSSSWAQGMLNATNEWPFSGIPLPNESDSQGYNRHSRGHHWKRFNSFDYSSKDNVFHRGVRCDGCGVHPIIGPRYKSTVKDDYDLCRVCYKKARDVANYIKIERPAHDYMRYVPFNGLHSLHVPPPTLPHAMRAPGSKLHRSKLDSRFILDVNVLDGTIMAPLTSFTKIWRMRNNGSIIWPRGSQLQWIGGDRLSNSHTVDIEIPVEGLPVDKELDVAVDFTAPELPGRYISYWRMASPAGQKFGQRVWVLIQVDASMKDLGETLINLNLPPVTKNVEVDNFVQVTESENTSINSQIKDQEMNFPINDSLIIDNNVGALEPCIFSVSKSTEMEIDTGLVDPVNDDPRVDSMVMSPQPSGPTVAAAQEVIIDEKEHILMKELEDMGFKQTDLNKEVLRKNNYDLEKSIDALCGVSDWDPMLDELLEMGFEDNEANMRLLKKNNGSIKRVVMDLINGEKP